MRKLITFSFLLALAAAIVLPIYAVAQDESSASSSDDDVVLLRINGTASLPAGETVDVAIMINGDIVIDGTVTGSLIVIRGDATVNGTVDGDVTVIRGTLDLAAGSTVDDVMLIDSDLTQDPAATVTGDIEERSGDFSLGRGFAVFSIVWWIGMLILGLVAAAVFAWLGQWQLYGAVATLRSQLAYSIVTAILLWIALPIVAVLIFATLVGIPLGLGTILVVLPVLFLLGTVVFGALIGSLIVSPDTTGKAIGAAMLGVLIVALVSLIPFVAVISGLAGMVGAGALVYRAFDQTRRRNPAAGEAPAAPGA
jgi:cytoskeletal protein CcmA (bactofilin family)